MTAISTQFIVFSGLFLTLYIVFTVHYICFVLFVSRKMSKRERGVCTCQTLHGLVFIAHFVDVDSSSSISVLQAFVRVL